MTNHLGALNIFWGITSITSPFWGFYLLVIVYMANMNQDYKLRFQRVTIASLVTFPIVGAYSFIKWYYLKNSVRESLYPLIPIGTFVLGFLAYVNDKQPPKPRRYIHRNTTSFI
ncbi:hypothetical protein DLAC_07335 [Tieghemostelium lacteum]|uniref:Transmembrane protein n=1 Tax=Tieghemostelium lacteum TaxID=361077 RepID=A0A151ZC92_TIELA|nr:hypothetical protein DLAC_07335 [Tieghemostelium lacteum]|eukprot:KYQ91567.1 hypothetical protein DLAC_07335 [Tieghemostelium lacteum]